jgi:hypothetical protein
MFCASRQTAWHRAARRRPKADQRYLQFIAEISEGIQHDPLLAESAREDVVYLIEQQHPHVDRSLPHASTCCHNATNAWAAPSASRRSR